MESEHLEDLGMNGKLIFKRTLRNGMEGCRVDQSGAG